jgi:hypothetical protein
VRRREFIAAAASLAGASEIRRWLIGREIFAETA